MYDYAFVRVPTASTPTPTPSPGYERVVLERAAQGWRLVQLFVEKLHPSEYVLIFERPRI